MPLRYEPINPKCPHFLHGGDYNPDQWPPEVWDEDMRLMKLAHCNTMTVGIFSWAQLEPEEGRYTFEWLDTIMDKLAANGAYAVLATPSAAQPAWMSAKYPEILVTGPDRVQRLHGMRINFCCNSPVYREKCRAMARRLAERYGKHPALLVWHACNEYGGGHGRECHCQICQGEFRKWLKAKYGTLDALNRAWWTAFWGHTYTGWDQIESPGPPYGEEIIHGLTLDWKRFVTDSVLDFMKNETAPLRELAPGVPVTTNFMGTFRGLDYWKLAPALDVISWDSYPAYHDRDDMWRLAADVSFVHDINRSFKGGKPFMQMEMTPSSANWLDAMKLKRPGMHRLQALQAVAHGADTVQYFQWRAGRGGGEKFHGAVVAHDGGSQTRVFGDVAEVGEILEKLDDVIGTTIRPQVAIIYDWENEWAISAAQGPRREKRDYFPTCTDQYRAFWSRGVPVDVINADCALDGYKLLIAPMLYMIKPGAAERIEKFAAGGGTFVTTYWSGIVDENDLAFPGGRPGPLRELLGIWSEELDALYADEDNSVVAAGKNGAGLSGEYRARIFCDLIHAEGATVLATYGGQFYAGRPAVTVNRAGKGRAYYIASRNDDRFCGDFYGALIADLGLSRALEAELPEGVTAQMRTDGKSDFVFLLNFKREPQTVDLEDAKFTDMLTGAGITGEVGLPGYGSLVLRRG